MDRRCIQVIAAVVALFQFDLDVRPLRAEPAATLKRGSACVVRPVPLTDVRWTDGFWADRFETLRTSSIPAMWEIMKGTKYKPFLQHFRIAAGEAEGDYRGAAWNDGDFYKFLEGVSAVYGTTHDKSLAAILDESIGVIGRAQRPDGYIHTPVLIRQRHGDASARPFTDRQDFEMYNMGHLITATCVHHRMTGRDEFLGIARKAADFLCQAFRDPTPELARNSVCPSHYMAMVDIYRETGELRYLALAKTFLEMRALVHNGGDDNQDRIPFLDQREAAGHAVRANYLYAGAADVFLETGDERLRAPLEAIWKNVVEKKLYITGGCGALYDGASPDGSSDQQHITRVHQAYGRNYQLPNTTAHNETCAAVGNVLWNWRMFRGSGDPRYVDVLELSLLNAVLAGVSLDGKNYFYTNPLRQVEPLPTELRWSRTRVPFVTSYCCPPNVLRTIAEVGGYAYGTSDDALWVNLYGSNELSTAFRGGRLTISQRTNYPWDGGVKITVREAPTTEFAIKLRVPGWVEKATLLLNGNPTGFSATPGTYAEVQRHWKVGDTLELQLPLTPQLIEANPLLEEARNQVAIKCGPIVYCLESPDVPTGVRVQDVVVLANTDLAKRYEREMLGGVNVVETMALTRPAGDWKGKLYRPLTGDDGREISIRLIPYYAWSNRGPSEMSVWLPMK